MYVTGTFDDWSKSEKLDKTGDHFAKEVTLPSADEKIYYKVRDGMNAYLSSSHNPTPSSTHAHTCTFLFPVSIESGEVERSLSAHVKRLPAVACF